VRSLRAYRGSRGSRLRSHHDRLEKVGDISRFDKLTCDTPSREYCSPLSASGVARISGREVSVACSDGLRARVLDRL
jgi:hypothetical protein